MKLQGQILNIFSLKLLNYLICIKYNSNHIFFMVSLILFIKIKLIIKKKNISKCLVLINCILNNKISKFKKWIGMKRNI